MALAEARATVPRRRCGALPLGLIVAAFVVVSAWNIGDAGFSGHYGAAARSMGESWPAFFGGAFDPSGTITIDKLPGFLWPQALSARILGFHAWSIALPQVVEGAVTIVAVHAIAARWRGRRAGLLAAAAFATTPLMPSMFGHTMEDALLTMSLALAFAAAQKALATGRWLPLVIAGAWVGVGFQAKMLQAWLIVPALALAFAFVLPGLRWGPRIRRAVLFAGVVGAVSVAWIAAAQLAPAASRPYADGSVTNNLFAQVFGYNGLNRFVPGLVAGAAPSFSADVIAPGADGASPVKLLLPAFTTQVGWLYPLALAGLVLVWRTGRGRSVDRALAVGLGGWLATTALVLSVAPVPHTAYASAVVVPVVVLAAVAVESGLGALKRGVATRERRILRLVVGLSVVWVLVILVTSGVAPIWVVVAVATAGAVSVGALGRFRSAVAAGLVALLLAPVVWTVSTLDPALGGTANDAYAGPRTHEVPEFFRTDAPAAERLSFARFAIAPPVLTGADPSLTVEQRDLVRYVAGGAGGGSPLFVTASWAEASPYILAGYAVSAVGGYSGSVPAPSSAWIRQQRFFLLPATVDTSGPTSGDSVASRSRRAEMERWVTRSCSLVADSEYEGATSLPSQSLWDCGTDR